MILEYREYEQLPRLAWLARLSRGSGRAVVSHGPWVETNERFFLEGAWDGPFQEGGFDCSLMLMGSGGIADASGVLFCGAAHPLERLFVLEHGDDLLVSSSLVFALTAGEADLDPDHVPYQADFLEFQRGLRHHVGTLPLRGGRRVTVTHMRNVHVDDALHVQVVEKPESPRFDDFADYKSFLIEGMQRFSQNANASERKVQYSPLSTVSSGYDSAACAALSVDFGCTEAVTLTSARPDGGDEGEDDSGAEIARALGLDIREYDRDHYRGLDSLPEAEFVACGDLGQDVVMVAMEHEFPKRFVLSGEHGDTMWSRQWDLRKDTRGARDIARPSCAGCSVMEFRLRVGFIHVPLPCIGATSIPDLKRISQSPEMAPWTLHNNYDRPIARRFLEEKGVARGLFGQTKKAVTVLLNRGELLRERMGDRSYASFRSYLERHRATRSVAIQALYDRKFGFYQLYLRLFRRVNNGLSRLGIAFQVPCPVPRRYWRPPGESSWLFHWGVAQIRDRYRLNESRDPEAQ